MIRAEIEAHQNASEQPLARSPLALLRFAREDIGSIRVQNKHTVADVADPLGHNPDIISLRFS
jgi:hypothetical protein